MENEQVTILLIDTYLMLQALCRGSSALLSCLLPSNTVNQMCMKANELFFKQVLNHELML